MITKKLALILSFLLLLMPLSAVACANEPGGLNDGETEKGSIFDSIPDYNFEGATFSFLGSVSTYQNSRNVFEEDEISVGSIDAAIHERNLRVGDAFNVVFEEELEPDINSLSALVDNLVASNDDTYDIICTTARTLLKMAAQNYLYGYDELDCVDMHGDAWIQWVNDIIEINNSNYFAFSDANVSLYDFTHMMLFNTEVLNRYQLPSPYDYVDEDTWTYDIMYYMMSKVSSDLDGDGYFTQNDMYGYSCSAYSVLPNFWIGAGEVSVEKKARGYFLFDLESNDQFFTVYSRIFEMFSGTNVWFSGSPPKDNRYYDTDLTFQTNHALFADHTFYSISQLRDMESDFGVVPYPKWDEHQDSYYSRVEAGTKTWGVLYIQDTVITGTIIEAMALDSHENLIHTYYDVTLQLKLTRDDKSIEMLDLIRNTMTYDPGDTLFCDEIRNGVFSGVFAAGKTDLASLLASNSSAAQAKINEINEYFKNN